MTRWNFAALLSSFALLAGVAVAKPSIETPPVANQSPTEPTTPKPGETTPATNAPPTQPNAPSSKVVSETRAGMGTRMQILVYTSDETGARAAIADCFTELTRLEQALSEWIPSSEVSKVNRFAGDKKPIKVGPDTLAVITAGKDAAERTGGAFAMTWLALGGLWKIPPAQGEPPRVPTTIEVERVLPLIGDEKIVIDAAASTVQLPHGGMALGLGAIGKGYAMDRIVDLLAGRGFKNVLVSAGGDVVARGTKGARPWSVGIQDPRGPGYFAVLNLLDQAISTAGDYERYFEVGGVRYHHIIDPRTGFPARGTRAVTVIANSGMLTDALDTGIFVMGPEAGMKLIEDDPRIEGLIIDDQNVMTVSSGLTKALRILRQPTL